MLLSREMEFLGPLQEWKYSIYLLRISGISTAASGLSKSHRKTRIKRVPKLPLNAGDWAKLGGTLPSIFF